MSLIEDFYTIERFEEVSVQKYIVHVCLNPAHKIFSGHFPGNPVTPGVCMMQIIKEITESITQKSLFLTKSSNVKFMALINPLINPILQLVLDLSTDSELIKVKNVTSFDDTVALKLTNFYKIK
ncbi:hypothetical protein [Sphingobacterium sp. LRF_L2]|uniref:hypothetical protein n=1 Tax=Sphingobacterium sp. LRF_L2 TaxID=3369421 RepID=UPI003F61AE77